MADKEKYMIKVEGKLVEVTPEVYYAYFRMERQARGQEEKKTYNNVMSYDALDDEKKKAIDNIPDTNSTSLEEIVIANDMKNRLHRALEMHRRCCGENAGAGLHRISNTRFCIY